MFLPLREFSSLLKIQIALRDLMRENSFHPLSYYYFGANFVNAIIKRVNLNFLTLVGLSNFNIRKKKKTINYLPRNSKDLDHYVCERVSEWVCVRDKNNLNITYLYYDYE